MQVKKNSAAYCFLAFIAVALWGSAFAGAKVGFEYMPPLMLSGFRFMLAGLLLVPLVYFMKISWREQFKHFKFMVLLGFVQTFLQYGLFYMGLDLVPGAVSAIIIGAGPLFVAVFAHFFLSDDKFTPRKALAVSLGVAGVISISITGEELVGTGPLFYRGICLLILSNIVSSFTNVMVVKHNGKGMSPIMLTLIANFSGGLMLLVASLFVEPLDALFSPLPLEFYGALAWLAFIPAIAFSIWYYLLSCPGIKVSELNVWKFLVPIIGVLFSWAILPDESPSLSVTVGILIIVSSVVVLQLPFKKKDAKH